MGEESKGGREEGTEERAKESDSEDTRSNKSR